MSSSNDQISSTPVRARDRIVMDINASDCSDTVHTLSPIKKLDPMDASSDGLDSTTNMIEDSDDSDVIDMSDQSEVLAANSFASEEKDRSIKTNESSEVVDDSIVSAESSSAPNYSRDKDRSRSILGSPSFDVSSKSSPLLRSQHRKGLREKLLTNRVKKRVSEVSSHNSTKSSSKFEMDVSKKEFNETRDVPLVESESDEDETKEVHVKPVRRRVMVDSSSEEETEIADKPESSSFKGQDCVEGGIIASKLTDESSNDDDVDELAEQMDASQLIDEDNTSGDESYSHESVQQSEDIIEFSNEETPEDSIVIVDSSDDELHITKHIQNTEQLAKPEQSPKEIDILEIDPVPVQTRQPFIGQHKVDPNRRPLAELQQKLNNLKEMVATDQLKNLPDGGMKVIGRIKEIELQIKSYDAVPDTTTSKTIDLTGDGVRPNQILSSHENFVQFAGIKVEPKVVKRDRPIVPAKKNWDHMLGPGGEDRLFGGKMTDNRWYEVRAKTEKTVASIHSSLSNRPPELEESADPIGLRLDLMRHQRQALSWMIWRESHVPMGGILADDMGLGKTLSMISLILLQKQTDKENENEDLQWFNKAADRQNLYKSGATLVVCPASLVDQWAAEVERRVKPNRLRVEKFTGPKNKRESNAKYLGRNDIVITTYGIVSTELGVVNSKASDEEDEETLNAIKAKKRGLSVLGRIAWARVILDEAHQIKNHKCKTARAICSIPAASRWCLSGTPIHNELLDFYSLVKFLRVSPFDELAVWKEMIGQLKSESQRKRLNVLSNSLLLRRTKNQMCQVTQKPIVDLQAKNFEVHVIELLEEEQKIYDKLFEFSRTKVKEFMKTRDEQDGEKVMVSTGGAKAEDFGYRNPFRSMRNKAATPFDAFQATTEILVLLLRLRQACVHLCLTKSALDLDVLFDDDDAKKTETGLEEQLANVSIVDDIVDDKENVQQLTALFEPDWPSTKLSRLLDGVQEIAKVKNEDASLEKCVIVSQWASLLDIVEVHLKRRSIHFTRISGDVPTQCRQERVDKFNKRQAGPTVMLLSLTAGGVGLNLIGGNHLFLLDLHWNPALEKQACDRIYRLGQTKPVYIHKYVCKGTIEERVLELQERKLALATSVLQGAADKSLSKLSMKDFKFLFELDSKKEAAVRVPNNPVQPVYPLGRSYATGAVMYPPGRLLPYSAGFVPPQGRVPPHSAGFVPPAGRLPPSGSVPPHSAGLAPYPAGSSLSKF